MSTNKAQREVSLRPDHYQTILSPVITEKATRITADRQYTFRVRAEATKPQVREAVEVLFKVKVDGVNILNRKGKTKRFRGRLGYRSDVRIAIVRLAEGNTIDLETGI